MTEMKSKSFEDLYVSVFKKNNTHCKFSVEEDLFVIDNPWGSDDSRLAFPITAHEEIRDLNNVILNPQFDAVFHIDTNIIEFIYGYNDPEYIPFKLHADREFELNLNGVKCACRFGEPTERLLNIAKGFRRLPSETGELVVPQMLAFRDAQRLDKIPKRGQEYFEGKIARNFFVQPDRPFEEIDIELLARHINFANNYYDRRSPIIVIRKLDGAYPTEKKRPLQFTENVFPKSLALPFLDDFILQLIEVAGQTSPRFAFVYYYQVIEYAGFYFLDSRTKRDLRQLLRDPSLISCAEDKVAQLFSFLSDMSHGDDVKMKKVIEEYCDPKVIWREVLNDKIFFSSPVCFDGGFELSPLIADDTTEQTWSTMWMPKLYDHLTKIRNCLVHAREKRQSSVIIPTRPNTKKIESYVHVIARVAEQIALNKE